MNDPQKPDALVKAKRSVRDLINSPEAKAEISKVFPKHLTAERMTRVALTATLRTPALLQCSPESLMNALLVCSQAGLEPDGRLAHLIPYGQVVQVIFDYKGLVTLALRNGAEAVFADKVCVNDDFEAWVENGDKKLTHKINWRQERGEAICYYSVCKRNGTPDWEVMELSEIQAIRDRSRAKGSGPWQTDFDEMAKKTAYSAECRSGGICCLRSGTLCTPMMMFRVMLQRRSLPSRCFCRRLSKSRQSVNRRKTLLPALSLNSQ